MNSHAHVRHRAFIRLVAILVTLSLTGLTGPVSAVAGERDSASTPSASQQGPPICEGPEGQPCKPKPKKLAKKYRKGKLGHTDTSHFPKKLKRKIIKKAKKKGYGRQVRDIDDWWDGFKNAADCVAPGAEASCAEDIDEVKKLQEPAMVTLICGGSVAIIYGSGGTATAALGTGKVCFWAGFVEAVWPF